MPTSSTRLTQWSPSIGLSLSLCFLYGFCLICEFVLIFLSIVWFGVLGSSYYHMGFVWFLNLFCSFHCSFGFFFYLLWILLLFCLKWFHTHFELALNQIWYSSVVLLHWSCKYKQKKKKKRLIMQKMNASVIFRNYPTLMPSKPQGSLYKKRIGLIDEYPVLTLNKPSNSLLKKWI